MKSILTTMVYSVLMAVAFVGCGGEPGEGAEEAVGQIEEAVVDVTYPYCTLDCSIGGRTATYTCGGACAGQSIVCEECTGQACGCYSGPEPEVADGAKSSQPAN